MKSFILLTLFTLSIFAPAYSGVSSVSGSFHDLDILEQLNLIDSLMPLEVDLDELNDKVAIVDKLAGPKNIHIHFHIDSLDNDLDEEFLSISEAFDKLKSKIGSAVNKAKSNYNKLISKINNIKLEVQKIAEQLASRAGINVDKAKSIL